MIKKNNWKAWIYLSPVIILMAVFIFYPLFSTIGIAFLKDYNYLTQTSKGFTWENFGMVLGLVGKDAEGNSVWGFGQSIVNGVGVSYNTYVIRYAIPNTLIIVFVTVPISTVIALLISVGLNSIPWLKKSLQVIFFVPYVTNAIAVGMVFAVLFDYQGIINFVLNDMGHPWIDQGASQTRAMFALCVYIIWQALPFKILIFLSGLAGIDKQYYDAAKIDAASRWNTLTKITVPLLSPQILYVLITSFIGAFKEYTSVVGLIGGPGTSPGSKNMYTVVYYIYDTIGNNQVQYGAAAAVLLFIVILLFTAAQFWISKKRVYY
jgi:multiple sugar transport system permease protein